MQIFVRNTMVFLFVFLYSCGAKDNGAKLHLDAARSFHAKKEFIKAKQEIDSLHALYPKALEERRAAFALLDSIRWDENVYTINQCDSLIALLAPDLERIKIDFSYQRNKAYQETGAYIPKTSVDGGIIKGTTLRSGVEDDGSLYLESIFVGGKQKHNQIKVSTKDGSYIESLPENGDGLTYRFSDMGNNYETVRFSKSKENGIAKFIFVNQAKPLTVTLMGQSKYSYTLTQTIKSSISKSFQLSFLMLQMDSLKTAKEKAEYFNFELDKKKNKNADDFAN